LGCQIFPEMKYQRLGRLDRQLTRQTWPFNQIDQRASPPLLSMSQILSRKDVAKHCAITYKMFQHKVNSCHWLKIKFKSGDVNITLGIELLTPESKQPPWVASSLLGLRAKHKHIFQQQNCIVLYFPCQQSIPKCGEIDKQTIVEQKRFKRMGKGLSCTYGARGHRL